MRWTLFIGKTKETVACKVFNGVHAARPVLVDTDEGWNKNIQFRCSHKTDTWGTKDWGPHQTVQKYRAQEAGKKVPRETVLQHSRKLQLKVSRVGRFFLVITRMVAKDKEPVDVARPTTSPITI